MGIVDEIKFLLDEGLRLSNGSVSALSRNIKVSGPSVSYWYRANSYPSHESLRKLEAFVIKAKKKRGRKRI